MKYILVNSQTGRIAQFGRIPPGADHPSRDGHFVVEVSTLPTAEDVFRGLSYHNGAFTNLEPEVPHYSVSRMQEYPSTGDQLGALWKLLAQAPELLTVESQVMLERINAVKAKYPKG